MKFDVNKTKLYKLLKSRLPNAPACRLLTYSKAYSKAFGEYAYTFSGPELSAHLYECGDFLCLISGNLKICFTVDELAKYGLVAAS